MAIYSGTRGGLSALLALCVAFAAAAAGCKTGAPTTSGATTEISSSTPTPELLVPTPTPTNRWEPPRPNNTWRVPPSLEEQIYTSDFIVRASLLSVTAGAETIPSADDGVAPTYQPVQALRLTVHEYLQGGGPSDILVVARGGHAYMTEAEARGRKANYSMSVRNATWYNRQGVLFLVSGQTAPGPAGASGDAESPPAQTFAFSRYNPPESVWDYPVDNLSRAWLPAQELGATAQAVGATGQAIDLEFVTDGAQSPPATISLAGLRSAVAEMAATLKAGEGIEGYETCIRGKILRERHRRTDPWTPSRFEKSLASGSAAGTEVYRGTNDYREPEYSNYWLSGPDESLFQALIVDDDSFSSNGYDHMLATARPLPAGEYRVYYNWQHYSDFPCNFVPDDAYWDETVTVTAPTGSLHEAFFDPVAIGSGVGADASNGALAPTAFTVGGAAVGLSSLKWRDGGITLTLSPYASLTGKALDLIALDGAADLSLSVDSAAVDNATGALTWTVATPPWRAGDHLMLRIRGAAGVDAPAPTAVPAPGNG